MFWHNSANFWLEQFERMQARYAMYARLGIKETARDVFKEKA
jgi:hypothetical protein